VLGLVLPQCTHVHIGQLRLLIYVRPGQAVSILSIMLDVDAEEFGAAGYVLLG